MNPVIYIKDLWFNYNTQPVLQGVDLEVREGDFLALIGPNGGGKTTLIKIMLGLLNPCRGLVRVLNQTPRQACHQVGYVPQNVGINSSFPITVMDVVLMGQLRAEKSRWGRLRRSPREEVRSLLEQLDIWQYHHRRIGELSGGQRQRVLIARALFSNPSLLLMDEPTANVDTDGQNVIFNLLKQLNRRMTIVVVSHDVMILSRNVTRVACVNRQIHLHPLNSLPQYPFPAVDQCAVELLAHRPSETTSALPSNALHP